MKNQQVSYPWAVVGAGPAGIATVGCLLDFGVVAEQILWIDPAFQCGDFGQKWQAVSSNTTVGLFLEFLQGIQAFDYAKCNTKFPLENLDPEKFCQLEMVAQPLQWVTDRLIQKVHAVTANVEKLQCTDGCWNLICDKQTHYRVEKVVLATGAEPRSLSHKAITEITLSVALNPEKLQQIITEQDTVAVFGSSHSAMIIIRNLLEAGVGQVLNFYLTPLRYAIKLDGWTLYDNSGLKGETAQWVRENISKRLHPKVKRYQSTPEQLDQHLSAANKAVYAIGFQQRTPISAEKIDFSCYDTSNGIIAPGLLGAGIGFPRKVVDPNGNHELNVGLWKFMCDLKEMIPIWSKYGL